LHLHTTTNRVVKHKHRHILELAHALRFQVILVYTFEQNVFPLLSILLTGWLWLFYHVRHLFERLHGKIPSYSHIRVFGSLAYATNVHVSYKFFPRTQKCIFFCYPLIQNAYKLYDLETHQVFTSCDVVFHEDIFFV